MFSALDYVLNLGRSNVDFLFYRSFFHVSVSQKPVRKHFAFVGVAGKAFDFGIPFGAVGAGNFIFAHSNRDYFSC